MKHFFISEFLDFIIPRFCVACSTALSTQEKFICNNCESTIELLSRSQLQNEFLRKFSSNNLIDDYTSLYIFEEGKVLQYLIHALKYDKKFKIGIFLGEKFANNKIDILKSWKADFIIPVPLFNLRRIERGYNQSFYIAKGLSREMKIPIKNTFVKRTKNTVSQTTLNFEERKENLNQAFILREKEKVRSKKVIIVDDVITTGATVSEIAKILKENGAEKVFAISIATPPFSHSIGSADTQNS
ncbi:Competence protein F homolog, phosphoribosyltransferase domain; protein YhgH required for utilization of DNA as sole source of carbon and energy [hydrothermal vent metagenome]|uniref:Competence protein F homolog, phosphoribosyltransferase domain protein YhgH required for utilization of DNA as sole source of carbon and energy n=1 Tax=hydrothermal vent metagenome TaxID=652676 RepID=A0A3B1DCI7_9ZZZZ